MHSKSSFQTYLGGCFLFGALGSRRCLWYPPLTQHVVPSGLGFWHPRDPDSVTPTPGRAWCSAHVHWRDRTRCCPKYFHGHTPPSGFLVPLEIEACHLGPVIRTKTAKIFEEQSDCLVRSHHTHQAAGSPCHTWTCPLRAPATYKFPNQVDTSPLPP